MRRDNRPPQVNFQADEVFIEDLQVMANRRGQTMSGFIRQTLEEEMRREAVLQVTD